MIIDYEGKKFDTSKKFHRSVLVGYLRNRLSKANFALERAMNALDGYKMREIEEGKAKIKELIAKLEAMNSSGDK